MIRLFYTKKEGSRFWPVDIKEDDQKKILAVCEDEENWIDNPKNSTLVKTALIGLKCRVFSKELLRMIDTELLVFHSLIFTDSSIWDSYYRTSHIYGIDHYKKVEESWKEYGAK